MADAPPRPRPLHWIGSSREDVRELPDDVQDVFGFALYQVQVGQKHIDAKPLRGFGGGSTLEVVADGVGNTYRAIYTIKFHHAVYVLHVFQKKSKKGIATPQKDIDRIKARLKLAAEHHRANYEQEEHQLDSARPQK
jgi:phage-related protein